jgi:hypothetical protein
MGAGGGAILVTALRGEMRPADGPYGQLHVTRTKRRNQNNRHQAGTVGSKD